MSKTNEKKIENEVMTQIEYLKQNGLKITKDNLHKVAKMSFKTYKLKYLNETTELLIKNHAQNEKQDKLFKILCDYVEILVANKKAVTFENLAELHGVSASRMKIIFKDDVYRNYLKQVKIDNKILWANPKFQEFYFKHHPFTKFHNLKASDIFDKHGQSYFDTIQNFVAFCKHYNIPFLRVNKSN